MNLSKSATRLHPLEDLGEVMLATGGLYAPTIRYSGGTVYVICTNVIRKDDASQDHTENFIVSTKDILSGEWSDPVYFEFNGIDPSLFFDEDGRVYIQGSASPGPMTKIKMFEIDVQTGKKLSDEKKIWDGTGGIYPEGPHLYKKDGWYYLLISEGGTHEGHMITVARSKEIWGPYEAYQNNPVLTARGTGEYIRYTGHCDMFQDQQGRWWGVCLGVRKDAKSRFIMGRETFITPGEWPEQEWPSLQLVKSDPQGLNIQSGSPRLTAMPMVDFLYIRDAKLDNYTVCHEGANVTIKSTNVDLDHKSDSPSFVGKRQRLLQGTSRVTMEAGSQDWAHDLRAGLAVYKDEHRFARIFYDSTKKAVVCEVLNNAKKIHRIEERAKAIHDRIIFRIEYTEQEYRLSWADQSASFQVLMALDTLELTDPDFVGPVIGVFALSDDIQADVQFSGLEVI
jgi:beta-xylosidase